MNDTTYLTLLNMAMGVAQKSHFNQFRRDGKTPYLEHPKAEAARLKAQGDQEGEILGWLHDVGEDDATVILTATHLLELGFPLRIVVAWELLTRRKGQTYEEHIQEIAGNALATEVKIADNLTNLSDSPTDRQIEKYAKSLLVLVEARKKHLR